MDLKIAYKSNAEGVNLVLDVQNSKRREMHQLSESQRYFIDIALRMALSEVISDCVTLYIDTPEGSLDIAYEDKAGSLFGIFSNAGHNIFMTANINTSQLLKSLAQKCNRIKLERMTTWTNLSQVQQDEVKKIESAYKNIEKLIIKKRIK